MGLGHFRASNVFYHAEERWKGNRLNNEMSSTACASHVVLNLLLLHNNNVNFLIRHFRWFMEDVNTIQRRFLSVPDLNDFRYLLNLPSFMNKLTDSICTSYNLTYLQIATKTKCYKCFFTSVANGFSGFCLLSVRSLFA